MNIEITVEEYFEQLKLMEQQYGQEEDLYPWIYMLLQMAECKKKEGKGYKKVSIRDVHKMRPCSYINYESKDITDKWKINRMLTKRVGAPDFVVFDEADKCIGAIEIKIIDEAIDMNVNNKNSNMLNENVEFAYVLGYFRAQDIEEADENIINKYKNNIEIKKCGKQIKVTSKDLDMLERCVDDFLKNGSKKLIEKYKEYDESDKKEKGIWSQIYKNNYFKKCSKQFQVLGHVDKFNKVIYTNGLHFCRLEKGNHTDVIVTELGNLTEGYKAYKLIKTDGVDPFEMTNEEKKNENYKGWVELVDNELWRKLLDELSKIDWHSEPTVKISTDNKED